MRRSSSLRRVAAVRSLLALWVVLFPGASWAAAARSYAYLLIQGTITEPSGGKPLAGATVRLTAESRVFEAVTDARGVFVFEKLPITSLEMRVTNNKGEIIRTIQPIDLDVPDLKRFMIRFGRGEERGALIGAREEGVTVVAPDPPVRWRRFWKQFGIFAGCAAVLAL